MHRPSHNGLLPHPRGKEVRSSSRLRTDFRLTCSVQTIERSCPVLMHPHYTYSRSRFLITSTIQIPVLSCPSIIPLISCLSPVPCIVLLAYILIPIIVLFCGRKSMYYHHFWITGISVEYRCMYIGVGRLKDAQLLLYLSYLLVSVSCYLPIICFCGPRLLVRA